MRSLALFPSSPVLLVLPLLFAAAALEGQERTASNVTRARDEPLTRETPTFYGDVLPILQRNCQVCHQSTTPLDRVGEFYTAGLVAPMALEEYEEVRKWAPAIARAVLEGRMPPWGAHVRHRGTFKGERYLEDREKATLVSWAEGGAPAGDPADAPPPLPAKPAHPGGWAIGEPDLIVRFEEPFLIEDNVIDQYVEIDVPANNPEPRWIKASQLMPGSNAVHHINSEYLGTVAPGREPYFHEEGFGILLHENATMMFDMHYHKPAGPGTGVLDRSGGGMVFYEDGEIITHVIETDVFAVTGFEIPAGASDYSYTGTMEFEEDTYLISTAPHMHYRGKAARVELEYPDGRRETILDIPRYDFAWQHKYEFREPLLMPAGSKLHLTGWWDNSADNPDNPDPDRTLRWGFASTDEMLTGRIFFAKAEPRHIVVGGPIPRDLLENRPRVSRESGMTTRIVTADDEAPHH